MQSLDLTTHIPRTPRAELDGLVLLPRTIDKIRATLPGGNLGPYHVAFGLSAQLLEALGVTLDELTEAVRGAESDEDVAAWLRTKSDASRYPGISRKLLAATQGDVSQQHRPLFDSLYAPHLRENHQVLFDLMDADDREIAQEREKVAH